MNGYPSRRSHSICGGRMWRSDELVVVKDVHGFFVTVMGIENLVGNETTRRFCPLAWPEGVDVR